MNRSVVIVVSLLAAVAAAPLCAQEADTASERERLGNERARIEAERRARVTEPEVEARAASPEEIRPATASPETTPIAEPRTTPAALATVAPLEAADAGATDPGLGPADAAEISGALEQLRELGELKDAGYVTDEEFERIKSRILETRF